MCMSTTTAPWRATSGSISGEAVTSLTMLAPASSAAAATSGLQVSTESRRPGCRARSAFDDRDERAALLPRVHRRRAGSGRLAADVDDVGSLGEQSLGVRDGVTGSRKRPPSEKESGVTLRMAITAGRLRAHRASTRESSTIAAYLIRPVQAKPGNGARSGFVIVRC